MSRLEYSGRLDSEYYRPSFLKNEILLQKRNSTPLASISDFLIGPFGSAFTVENYTSDRVYRYIRGKDVKQMRLMDDDNVYMPKSDFDRLSKYALRKNDILVSVVGTLGNAAIIEEQDIPAIFSCKSTVLRTTSVNPFYLLTYLNSSYGRSLLLRKERGAVQKGLNLDDLKTLEVFVADEPFQKAIETLYKTSVNNKKLSEKAYSEAESLLLETLGVSKFVPKQEDVNIKLYSNSFATSGRLDAEYYHPKYEELETRIKTTHKLVRLGTLLSINQRGTQPDYCEEGLPVINSKHVREGEVILYENRRATLTSGSNQILIQHNDVLINGTGVGTIGRSATYLYDEKAIPDNHVTVLRTTKVNPIFLSVYLNSIAGKYQVEKYFKGSSGQIELYPTDIDCFYVPMVSTSVQSRIAELIQESFSLKAKSLKLLDVAKKAVDIAVEKNETAARKYLAEATA